ncbi:hypothetical protein G4B88_021896 [Cannabis sativa]|uniref:Uncharacterized protein n=1 Tax=Cannabis sativa TaxID=3483 RepID=A0A7J6H0Q7_CANSA|nr:hypothetical protein G4B88_021896 [Cannabis sativa]
MVEEARVKDRSSPDNGSFIECRSKREMPSLYRMLGGILQAFKEKGVDLAIASRSPAADTAKTFLDKLNITTMFVAKEHQEVSKMGVTSILVGNGVNLGALRQGLTEFCENVNTSEKNKQRWIKKFSGNSSSSDKNEKK